MTNKNSKSVVQVATEGRRPRNTAKRKAALASACAAIGLLAASAAYSEPAESAATDQLVEITVTAQRHVENAQKVPISVVPITSVAVYLDDIYIPDGDASIFQLNAISGIDVLKGPQGTLFGRNATGGVVQVHTKDPQFDPS